MAVVNTLAADVLSLRGSDSEYHRISRFFRNRSEAVNALADESWVPDPGVLNVCIVGDEGLLIYDGTDTVVGHQLHNLDTPSRTYTDTKLASIVGDSPDALNTLSELAQALKNNPDILDTLSERLDSIEDGVDFTGRISAPVTDNVIPFYHDFYADFPDPGANHGAVAHAHDTGMLYFAHGGMWNPLVEKHRCDTVSAQIDKAVSLSGVPLGDNNLGDFNGSTINSGSNIKQALQSLETILEAIDIDTNDLSTLTGIAENVTNLGAFDGSTIGDGLAVKAAMQQLETAVEAEVTNRTNAISALPTMIHASWDASTAGSFDFANDGIASSGVSGVTRTDVGKYRVTFSTPFATNAYTATCGVGSTDYSGSNASPREVSIMARDAAYVDVICERSDDAVNEDNFYMSVIIMG